MNYQQIHDTIIERARLRSPDRELYQQHHVVPRYLKQNNDETVPVSIKEHAILHLLLHKIAGEWQNLVAFKLLRGYDSNEAFRFLRSEAGKIGSKVLIDQKLGIFSDKWNRSVETKRRHREGLIPYIPLRDQPGAAKRAGMKSVEQQAGIHAPNYNHSQTSKETWASYSSKIREQRNQISRNNRIKATQRSVELGCNFSSDLERQKKIASLGGLAHRGKKWWTNGNDNIRSFVCPDGFNPGRKMNNKRKSS